MTAKRSDIFRTLVQGYFSEKELRVIYRPEPRILPDELLQRIAQNWKKLTKAEGQYLFNGPLCRLDGYSFQNGLLQLHLGKTDYQELVYSNQHGRTIIRTWGEAYLSSALGISAVVISQDDKIVLMKRSESVGEYPGRFDVFGGHIHPTEDAVAGVPDPFVAMRNELKEELNLDPGQLQSLISIGLIANTETQKPELLFKVKVPSTLEKIISNSHLASGAAEFECLFGVDDTAVSLKEFLHQEEGRLSPSAYGALWVYGQQQGYI